MYITSRTLAALLRIWNPRVYGSDSVFYFDRVLVAGSSFPEIGQERSILLFRIGDFLRMEEEVRSNANAGFPAACIIAGGKPESALGAEDGVFLFLDDNAPLEDDVFSVLMRYVYMKNEEISLRKEHLLHLMSRGKSLQSVLCAATRFMENPFIVYDSHYMLVAHSIPQTLDIPEARNVVKNGYANVDIVSQMEEDGSLEYLFSRRDDPCLVRIVNGYEKLAVRICHEDRPTGLLCFFNYVRPISEDDYELVRFLGQLTGIYFHNHIFSGYGWTAWDYLFSALLKQKRSVTMGEINRLKLEIPNEMRLMAISPGGISQSDQADQLRHMQMELHRLLPSGRLYFYEGCLLCLDSLQGFFVFFSSRRAPFFEILDRLNLFCGLSNPFYSILELHTAFNQAEAALRLRTRDKESSARVFEYSRVTVSHMLHLLGKNYPLESFCHPIFSLLERYDREYSTNYLVFFLVYLLCGRNAHLCSEYFQIHYNSVRYRLNVIKELGEIDLKDENTVVLLYISSRIYLEKNLNELKKYIDFLP